MLFEEVTSRALTPLKTPAENLSKALSFHVPGQHDAAEYLHLLLRTLREESPDGVDCLLAVHMSQIVTCNCLFESRTIDSGFVLPLEIPPQLSSSISSLFGGFGLGGLGFRVWVRVRGLGFRV